MDFKQLESFVAAVDEGSFSNAAERLQLSQSMVTIHIRNLESELGTRLLNRTTRSMELSPSGRTFYSYARQMLKLNRDSIFALSRANQEVRAIIEKCYAKAKEIILKYEDVLHKSAELLVEKEKIGREEFEALFEGHSLDVDAEIDI